MILEIFFALLSAYYTFNFHKKFMVTSVQASASVTLFLLLFLKLLEQFLVLDSLLMAKIIFGASFVGMCSPKIFSKNKVLLITFIFIALFYLILEEIPYSSGALGFLAFLSVQGGIIIKKLAQRL